TATSAGGADGMRDMDGHAELRDPALIGSAAASVSGDQLVLSLDAFIRSVGVRRASPFAMFVGAGASFRPDLYLGMEAPHLLDQQPGPRGTVRRTVARRYPAEDSALARYARYLSGRERARRIRLLYQRMLPYPGRSSRFLC